MAEYCGSAKFQKHDGSDPHIHESQVVAKSSVAKLEAMHPDTIGSMDAESENSLVGSLEVSTLLPVMVTVSTQTDDYDYEDDDEEAYYLDLQSCPMFGEGCIPSETFLPPGDQLLAEMELEGVQEFEDDLCRAADFEYEEVTIFRVDADQKIGLTLCYGEATNEITDVFVSEVDPLSIAGADGRIKEGDQILQINGFDVHTRQQAVRMFAESGSSVMLLLARTSAQFNDSMPNDVAAARPVTNGKTSKDGQNGSEDGREFYASAKQRLELQTDDLSGAISIPLDERSGGDPADSIDLESKIAALNEEMKRMRLQYQEFMTSHHNQQQLQQQQQQRLPELTDVTRSPRMVPRMGTRMDTLRQVHVAPDAQMTFEHLSKRHQNDSPGGKASPKRVQQKRTTYGEDSSSPPPAAQKQDECGALPRLLSKPSHSDMEQNTGFGYADGAQKEWSSDGDGRVRNLTAEILQEQNAESLQMLYNQYIEVMYTNEANLQHTIMVQQNLFQQQLAKRNASLAKFGSEEPAPGPVLSSQKPTAKHGMSEALAPSGNQVGSRAPPVSTATGSDVQMEWVVKRRADGSRYITRRPVRNRILKERARKLAEERCGLTTDDDAVSELKVGRYWSKEDRKRHLQKARDHKRQKELLLRQQLESAKENYEARKEGTPLELGSRKSSRHKGKKTSDESFAVFDLVSHRSRDMHGKSHNPLLSVTTV